MVFIHDTRDQRGKHANVENYLTRNGHSIVRSKMYCGDIALLHDQSVCIDLKRDLQEVCGNLTQQHARFRDELIRAQEAAIRLIVLIEHSSTIKSLDDVRAWCNPRLAQSPRATTGGQLAAIMESMAEKYGVEWRFCAKQKTGREVCRILEVE